MKRVLVTLILLLVPVVVTAQLTYPVQVFVAWDMNIPEDNVIDYTLVHNNGLTNVTHVILNTTCSPTTGCRQALQIPGASLQTVTLTARNEWGVSSPVAVNFRVTAPGNARNIKITKN